MPSGRTHDIITASTTPLVILSTYSIFQDLKLTILFSSLYLFSSLMFNGDLDIKSRPYNRWLLFKYIWLPYRKLFNHRSIWTHGIIIGTIVRIIYFVLIVSLLLGGTYLILDIIYNDVNMIKLGFKISRFFNISVVNTYYEYKDFGFSNINWGSVMFIFLGLELGNTIHTLSDKLIPTKL